MDFSSQIVPAVIILVANLLSGKHTSLRWEYVTAIFGWGAVISLPAFLVVIIFFPGSSIANYLGQIAGFCILTALSRDYERILKPLFPWNR
jgi:hypothetical protein